MAPVITPKIKEESFLISSDHFRYPHVTNFILCRQLSRSVNIQFRSWSSLTTVARYEASAYIIWKPNKTLWRFRTLLLWHGNNQVEINRTCEILEKIILPRNRKFMHEKQEHLIGQYKKSGCFIDLCQNVSKCCPPFIPGAPCRNNDSTAISTNRCFRYLHQKNLFEQKKLENKKLESSPGIVFSSEWLEFMQRQ